MQVGVGLPDTISGTNAECLLDWARMADSGPFSSLGVFDRLLYDSYEPMTTLAAAAGVTNRIRLATTIAIGPLRNTTLLAKMALTIDALSQGRFTLGLSVGARQDDYEIADVPLSGRGRRLTQQLAALRNLWENESFGPSSARPGGPELLIGGLSDNTYARLIRFADGYVHGGGPPRAFQNAAQKACAAWEDAGRPGKPKLWGMGYFAFGEEEGTEGKDYLRDYYAFTGPFAERIAQGLLNNQQEIAQFMRGYADAGCDELILFPTSSDLNQLEQLTDCIETLGFRTTDKP